MYKYDLKISIFSEDEKIEEMVKNIPPLSHYTHTIVRHNHFNHLLSQLSDVVIVDEKDLDGVDVNGLNDVKVILCANKYREQYKNFTSIIQKPFSYNHLVYELKRVLKQISLEDEIQFTNACLTTAANGMNDMFWIKSLDGTHVLLNDKFCEVADKQKEDITGKDHYYIWDVSKDDPNSGADLCKQTEDAVIERGHTLSFYETVKSKNGIRQLVTYKSPIYDKKGHAVGTVGLGHDITDLKNLGKENQIILDVCPDAMLMCDENGIIKNVNNFFENYFDVSKDDVIDIPYETWVNNTFSKRQSENEYGNKEGIFISNGEEKNVELRFKNIIDIFGNTTGQMCAFRDVTLERKLQKRLEDNANIDTLTGINNSTYLREYIKSIPNGEILSLFYMDLDHFKHINDTYGHQMGDDALILTAKILKSVCKEDLVVRLHGDEFLIVKRGSIEKEKLAMQAEKIIHFLKEGYQKIEEFAGLSASIGIAQGELEKNKFSNLVHESDTALYVAKDNGKSTYAFSEKEKVFQKN